MNKKGFGLGDLAPIGITILVVSIVLGLGSTVISNMQGSLYANTSSLYMDDYVAGNVTLAGQNAMASFGTWLPTIALVAIVAVILGIVTMYLMRKM